MCDYLQQVHIGILQIFVVLLYRFFWEGGEGCCHFPCKRVYERLSSMQFADFFAAYYARIYYLLRTIFDKILYHQENFFPGAKLCFVLPALKVIIYKFYLLFKTLTLIRTAMKQNRYSMYMYNLALSAFVP